MVLDNRPLSLVVRRLSWRSRRGLHLDGAIKAVYDSAMRQMLLAPLSGTTLYSQIASILRGRIARGEWKIGHEIPTIDELCEQYGVARISVRQAIQLLVAEGLLSSHRGRRTLVLGSGLYARPLSTGVAAPLEQVPDYSVIVLRRDEHKILPDFAVSYGKPESVYIRISKIDREVGIPYSVSEIYVAKSVYRRFPRDAENTTKVAELVREASTVPLRSARERIMVGAADHDEAHALGVPLSSPVARVERLFIDAKERIVYAGRSVYRGDRFLIERDLLEIASGGHDGRVTRSGKRKADRPSTGGRATSGRPPLRRNS